MVGTSRVDILLALLCMCLPVPWRLDYTRYLTVSASVHSFAGGRSTGPDNECDRTTQSAGRVELGVDLPEWEFLENTVDQRRLCY